MVDSTRKRLLVEGHDDKYAIAELMGHYIAWPNDKEKAPVNIEPLGSPEQILVAETISVRLKSPEIEILGVLIDANNSLTPRWQTFRNICGPFVASMPAQLPPAGYIAQTQDGKSLGIWMMPDNQIRGMLETFLQYLVPDPHAPTWQYAISATAEARNHAATYRDAVVDKARIHTWLAWMDPPGLSFGRAILQGILNARDPAATPLVTWFRALFQV